LLTASVKDGRVATVICVQRRSHSASSSVYMQQDGLLGVRQRRAVHRCQLIAHTCFKQSEYFLDPVWRDICRIRPVLSWPEVTTAVMSLRLEALIVFLVSRQHEIASSPSWFHLGLEKLEPHGTDTDTDTDIRDAPIEKFCKRVHDSLSCRVHVHVYTRASPNGHPHWGQKSADKSARIVVRVRLVASWTGRARRGRPTAARAASTSARGSSRKVGEEVRVGVGVGPVEFKLNSVSVPSSHHCLSY